MRRVLVTGFEPFGGADVNASQQLVEALAAEPPDGVELATAVLPVEWATARRTSSCERSSRSSPSWSCASARQTAAHTSRSSASRSTSTRASTKRARQRRAEILADGPIAYRSSLPVDAIVDALRADGIPAAASRDPGGFLCNHVFYVLMDALAERAGVRGGFVHVPLLPEQALDRATPTVPLETLVRAAWIILAAARS